VASRWACRTIRSSSTTLPASVMSPRQGQLVQRNSDAGRELALVTGGRLAKSRGVWTPSAPTRCDARKICIRRHFECGAPESAERPFRNAGGSIVIADVHSRSLTSWVTAAPTVTVRAILWSVPDDSGTQVRLPASPAEIVSVEFRAMARDVRLSALSPACMSAAVAIRWMSGAQIRV